MKYFRIKMEIVVSLGITTEDGEMWDPRKDGIPGSIHRETYRTWMADEIQPSIASLGKIAEFVNSNADELAEDLKGVDFADKVSIADFARKLGKSDEDIDRYRFSAHFKEHSPHNEYLFETRKDAELYLRQHRGFYYVYRIQDDTAASPLIVRMGMAIRSVEQVTGRGNRDRYVIGAALSVPSVKEGSTYLYTGVVCATQMLITYNFVQDSKAARDFALLMASGASNDKFSQRLGHMLTMRQNGEVTQPASYRIVIHRVDQQIEEPANYEQFLHEAAVAGIDPDPSVRKSLGLNPRARRRPKRS